jgi:hypothetical protein
MRVPLALVLALLAAVLPVAAQTDLDRLMADVVARRDDNWKKLQQYVLREEATFRVTGPQDTPLFGSRREYVWFPRQGFFIRSPVSPDGVTIGVAERRRQEDEFLAEEQRRERRRAQARGTQGSTPPDADAGDTLDVSDVIRQSVEPQFVSAAYFLRFRFEPGHYALAGREQLLGRDVLRIEYYPERLFRGRRGGRGGGGGRGGAELTDEDRRIIAGMNKVSLVTLWVEPKEKQILQYEFENVDPDFLPGRWLLRLDGMRASMRMGEPFPGVWLPASLGFRMDMSLAIGTVGAIYDVQYRDYGRAETDSRVVVP